MHSTVCEYLCACMHAYLCACMYVIVYMCVSIYARVYVNEYSIIYDVYVCELVCMCVHCMCVDPFVGEFSHKNTLEIPGNRGGWPGASE